MLHSHDMLHYTQDGVLAGWGIRAQLKLRFLCTHEAHAHRLSWADEHQPFAEKQAPSQARHHTSRPSESTQPTSGTGASPSPSPIASSSARPSARPATRMVEVSDWLREETRVWEERLSTRFA